MKSLVTYNPCGMPDSVFRTMSVALRTLIGKEYHTDMSLEQLSRWLNVSTRTIHRWQKERGFPKGKEIGHHELSFSIDEVTAWLEHNDTTTT